MTDEDGTNCSWPYTLDHGSPDVAALMMKASGDAAPFAFPFPELTPHAGLWAPTTLSRASTTRS